MTLTTMMSGVQRKIKSTFANARFVCLLIMAICASGCILGYKDGLPTDPVRFKEYVLERISLGEDLNVAQNALENLGFETTRRTYGGLYGDMAFDPPQMHENIDYLALSKITSDYKWLWGIALKFEEVNGEVRVTDVFVQVHDRRGLPGTTRGTREKPGSSNGSG